MGEKCGGKFGCGDEGIVCLRLIFTKESEQYKLSQDLALKDSGWGFRVVAQEGGQFKVPKVLSLRPDLKEKLNHSKQLHPHVLVTLAGSQCGGRISRGTDRQ